MGPSFHMMMAALAGSGGATGNDSFTKILLHFDGSDGSTTITDSNAGGSAHTWTANGDAQIDTAQSKFGGASGLFDGTGDYVSTPDHADFSLGSGDWVIDCFVRCTASGQMHIAGQCNSAGVSSSIAWLLEKTSGNVAGAAVYDGSYKTITGSTTINTGSWVHLALVCVSNTVKLYVNGTKEGTDLTSVGTINNSSAAIGVGAFGEYTVARFNGWIDEFRMSVGTNRGWTGSSFTVPTAAYG